MKLPRDLQGRRNVVLDTMVFIYLFEDSAGYASACEHLVAEMGKGTISGLVTPITAAELLVKPLEAERHDIADRYRGALRSMTNLDHAPLTMETGYLAGALRAKYGLPLPDMMQAATALLQEQPSLVTNDKALRRIEEIDVFLLDDIA